jgi:hypothetical protein
MTVSSAPSSDSKSKLMISLAESKEQELSTPAQRMPCPKETGCKSLNYLVEREGLDRVGGGALGVTLTLASARRSNCSCRFPASSFHEELG